VSTAPADGPDAPAARPRPRGRARRGALIAGGALALLAGAYGVGYAVTGNTLPARTSIGGVQVGGLSPAGAEAALRAGLAPRVSAPVTLKAADTTVTEQPAELGLAVDYAASVRQAGGRKTLDPGAMLAALAGGGPHPVALSVDESKLAAGLAAVAKGDHEPTDAALAFKGITPTLTAGKDGHALRTSEAPDAVTRAWPAASTIQLPVDLTAPDITTAEAQLALDTVAKPAVSSPITLRAGAKTAPLTPDDIAASLTFAPRDGALAAVLDPGKLARLTDERLAALGAKEPVDATVKMGASGKPVVVASKDGYGVEPQALASAVLPALTKTTDRVADVTLTVVKPALDTAAATKLGVKEITGEFSTVFPGKYPYRYVNIPKAASMINNTFLRPGDSFSLNDALGGERTIAGGWAAGFGISEGSEVVTPGGGISQATTTLYNAIFFAGLEDIEHKPHSLYFNRYPQGREATLSWPDVDLKFRNDSPYGVLLQAWTTGHPGVDGTITVRVWSTKVYDVKQANTVITNARNVTGTKPTPDDSPTCVAQEAADGFDIRFDRQFYQNGKLVKSVPYFWHYNTLLPTTCTNPAALKANQDLQQNP